MGEIFIIVLAVLINAAVAIGAVRIVWWLFQIVVRGTGKAWRGE